MSANFRPAGEPAAIFVFGEFTFDCGSRLLMRNGVKRHLSLKAQQLLHLLILARPRALSREELYDALWPSTFVCETNLASIINEVRRALGDDARKSQYVRTVHGFGYAFCGEIVSPFVRQVVAATLTCEEQTYSLFEGENSVGRADDCRVRIAVPTISRRHALIAIYEDDAFTIMDLDSTNGTYVDGQKIGRLPVLVTHKAQISFGVIGVSINLQKAPPTTSSLLVNSDFKRRVAARASSA